MGYEFGGYAAKLGSRYEGRWVVLQMFYVLAGRLRSVTVESVGDDERGVDLWVETNDGHREGQQCKGEHGTKSQWSMADLNNKGILASLHFQLERNGRHGFALVSSVLARSLLDLSRRARDSGEKAQDFYDHQVKPAKELHKEFLAFCRYLNLKPSSPAGIDLAHHLLRRSDFHLFAGDRQDERELEMWAWHLVSGDPSIVVSVLADFAEFNLRKSLTFDTILEHLCAKGFAPKDLAHDDRIATRIGELRTSFAESINGQLAGGELIARSQASELLAKLNSADSGSILVLHGRAGYGKSGVLFELTELLQEQRFPFLPLRLDRQVPRGSAQHFGETLGLRESPAMCVSQLVCDKPAVLILDQIDAMRWTSGHSSEPWLTCQELIRQATRLGNVRVIVACRTFDLENDPQFTAWARSNQLEKLEVGDLDEATIRKCTGGDYDELNGRQRNLLKSVQNLAMWLELRSASATPSGFVSATDLMQRFWDNRYQELSRRGIAGETVQRVLDALIDHFNEQGELTCPYAEIQPFQQAVRELQSLNVIGVNASTVTFCHQSYADYLLAARLAREMSKGNKTVFDWLGPRSKQSLFRREQLRLLLHLMRDQKPAWYSAAIASILESTEIRFHLKHLCLQVLGQVETPNSDEIALIMRLLGDAAWKDHVIAQVLGRNVTWMNQVQIKRQLAEWLSSADEELIGNALWLLRGVDTSCGDLVAEMIEPFDGVDEKWDKRLDWMYIRSPNEDSERLFALRLRRVTRNLTFDYVDWVKLAKEAPQRCLPLIASRLKGFLYALQNVSDDVSSTHRSQRRSSVFEITTKEEMEALETIAVANGEYVRDELIPLVEQVLNFHRGKVRDKLSRLAYVSRHRRLSYRFLRPISQILVASGRVLLAQDFTSFSQTLLRLSAIRAKAAQQIVMNLLLAGSDENADWAIDWLIEKPTRLQLGRKLTPSRFAPARRLIKRFAPHCSHKLYRRLEDLLLNYHPKDEWQSCQFRHHEIMAGMCRDYSQPNLLGMAHFFLLSALPRNRMSGGAIRESGVAQRKFRDLYPRCFDRRLHGCGGTIVSPIPSNRLHLVSDTVWLKIISEFTTDREHGSWRQIDDEHAAECSAETFSRDLEVIAQRQPRRFARLALHIPRDTSPQYLTAIMRAFEANAPPDGAEDDEAASWEPVPAQEIESVFQHARKLGHRGLEHSFCRVVQRRPEAGWSGQAIADICKLAISHREPKPGALPQVKKWKDRTVNDLETASINYVRGPAAHTIRSLLFHDPKLLPQLRPAIDAVVSDAHPGVRIAAAGICHALWNIDRELAMDLFLKLSECKDSRVLPSGYAVHFVNYAQVKYLTRLIGMIKRMVQSPLREVHKHGAARITFLWLCTGQLAELFERCRKGSAARRKGVASVAANNATHAKHGTQSRTLLQALFDDSDPAVRKEAVRVFRRVDILDHPEMEQLVLEYLSTAAFRDDPTELLDSLEDYKGSLHNYRAVVFAICDALGGELAEATRTIATSVAFDADKVPPLLLRLYEQAQGSGHDEVQQRCLDTWDLLLERRVGTARGLIDKLDV